MLPHMIHCCWFGGPKTSLAEKCEASWRRFVPDWQICEWDECRVIAELGDLPGYSFFNRAIAMKKWAAASDWLRMASLWKKGGLYLDFDHELVAPLDDLMDEEWVASEFTVSGETEYAAGAGLALQSGSSLAGYMLEQYAKMPVEHVDDMMPWIVAQMSAFFSIHGRIKVLPPEMMSPIDTKGVMHRTAQTRGIHHYAMSWASRQRRAARWLSWHGLDGLVKFLLRLRRCR